MKKDIINLFCFIDDFTNECKKELKKHALGVCNKSTPTRIPGLTESEVVTIILMFQESPCRNFKFFYNSYLKLYKDEFPEMPTYERFVSLMPRVFIILLALYLRC